ncbi:MAG: nucleotidyltransferase family protein [Thermoprotei archaeon]
MKAVITAAGKGSRMNPSTKAIPKGLLPLFSNPEGKLSAVPIIRLIIDQLQAAGVDDICVVVGEKKDPLITYLLGEGLKITFVQQDPPAGFADAVAKARAFVKGDPFFVHADDGIPLSTRRNLLRLMWQALNQGPDAVLLIRESDNPSSGGVVVGKRVGDHIEVSEAFEKIPRPPSNWALTAVYAFSGKAMDTIAEIKPGRTGEAELTDAISLLAREGRVIAFKLDEDELWLNVGNPESYHVALELSYAISKGLDIKSAMYNSKLGALIGQNR